MTINQKIKDLVFSEMKKAVHSDECRFGGWDIHLDGKLFNFYIVHETSSVMEVGDRGYEGLPKLYEGIPEFVVVKTEDGSYELLKMME